MEPHKALDTRLATIRNGMFAVGSVTGTATGNKVIVSVSGASMTLPKLASYSTVTTGDLVQIACPPGRWFVLGKIG